MLFVFSLLETFENDRPSAENAEIFQFQHSQVFLSKMILKKRSELFGESVDVFFMETRPHYWYISVIFADTSSAHLKLFNFNGQSLFLLCSAGHLMCHPDWQRSRGPICKCCLAEPSRWRDIHQKLFALFLVFPSHHLHAAVELDAVSETCWGGSFHPRGRVQLMSTSCSSVQDRKPAGRKALDSWAQVKTS